MFITTSCSDEPWYENSDSTDLSSRLDADGASNNFYRNHAIGYSYNALEGEYCNSNDVRCQVINRKVLEQAQAEMHKTLFRKNLINKVEYNNEVYTSVVEYAQNTNVGGGVSGGLLLFHGSVQKACSIFEDGTVDTYILHDEMTKLCAKYYIDTAYLQEAIKQYPNILTSSFRAAIDKLGNQINDRRAIEDFIQTYGTHVVTYVSLGAKLSVDVQVETRKFNTQYSDTMMASATLGTLFKTNRGKSTDSKEYGILRDNHCKITAMGGDVSILDSYISMSLFDASNSNKSDLDKWLGSIIFENSNMANSNVEVFEMNVSPIWKFIPNKQVAAAVQTQIKGDAAILQNLLGNRNFINTAFEAHPQNASCKIRTGKAYLNQGHLSYMDSITYEKSEPWVVDIIAANRHVATVCREYVPGLGTSYVAYPIYDGRMKMTDGLCITGGNVYSVGWRYGQYEVEKIGNSTSDSIYINAGVLSASKQEGLNYQTSHAMLGAERIGALTTSGDLISADLSIDDLKGIVIPTRKYKGSMYLADIWYGGDYYDGLVKELSIYNSVWMLNMGGYYYDLPGWEYVGDVESKGTYAPHNRMKRKDDYIYVYSPCEIDYD